MNPSCLKHTLIPGTSRLFLDYLYHFDRLEGYFDWNPFNPESFGRAAEQIRYPAERRAALVEALSRQNPGAEALDRLAHRESVAVVTGQQVGLFSGPAYTIYKAVTAVRLARRLTEEGLCAVPVFWLATEDHDLAEVNHAWVFDSRTAQPIRLEASTRVTSGPVGAVPLSDIPFQELTEALDGLPYASDVLASVQRAYQPGATLGAAFKNLLKDLLKDLGLLFLDPLDPAIRDVAAPFLADAARRAPALVSAIRERSAQLEGANYHSQVHVESDSSPVFLLNQGRRISFKIRDGRFVNKYESYSTEELERRSSDISPNALLRPVMQDYLLPTVAYVGGPAEIAYMAQAQVVYREMLGRMPVIMPRNGFTLLHDRTTKLLGRYRIQVQDLLTYEELARERIAQRLVPAELDESFSKARRGVDEELSRLSSVLTGFDPTLEAAARRSGAKIRYQLEKVAKKTSREALRRNKQASEDAAYLTGMIYPLRHLQERFYTILPFLAQYGPDLVGRLLKASSLDCPDHMIRSISDLPH
jgi:bacillithiol biosynthesis cysteine-adding enzyme BshC